MQVNTYLSFDGDCREAFEFYEQCLGGKIQAMMTFGDGPGCNHVPAELHGRIMHGSIRLGEHFLMGTDGTPDHPYSGINGAHVVLSLPEPEEAERAFEALSEQGRVEMPIQETFWARRFGMTVDRFGVPWMVNCDKEA
ncbi:MAG: VOC family protein [Arenicellales bacterium]